MTDRNTVGRLIEAARAAREFAHATYSGFRVGAAVEAADGRVFTGCNIENATYGLTLCAERVAVFKAMSEGAHGFTRVVVLADTDPLTPPCGSCRQILSEFCPDAEIVMANLQGRTEIRRIEELFPSPFHEKFFR